MREKRLRCAGPPPQGAVNNSGLKSWSAERGAATAKVWILYGPKACPSVPRNYFNHTDGFYHLCKTGAFTARVHTCCRLPPSAPHLFIVVVKLCVCYLWKRLRLIMLLVNHKSQHGLMLARHCFGRRRSKERKLRYTCSQWSEKRPLCISFNVKSSFVFF